mgnify:CR=1 FL=1
MIEAFDLYLFKCIIWLLGRKDEEIHFHQSEPTAFYYRRNNDYEALITKMLNLSKNLEYLKAPKKLFKVY